MKHVRPSLLFLLAVATAAPAQEKEVKAATAAAHPSRYALVSFSFAGGTMGAFVRELCIAEPTANVTVAKDAETAEVPRIELREAGLSQALEAACAVARGPNEVRVASYHGVGASVYSIVAVPPPPGPQQIGGRAAGGASHMQVLSLNELTDEVPGVPAFRVETILSAIEAGIGQETPAPTLRYHEDSGLLIVRGTLEQHAFVREVLKELSSDRKERLRRAHDARKAAAPAEHVPPEHAGR